MLSLQQSLNFPFSHLPPGVTRRTKPPTICKPICDASPYNSRVWISVRHAVTGWKGGIPNQKISRHVCNIWVLAIVHSH
ncbi:hypothetical protein BDN71DRAFT_1456855 [Pleurotus eryngii]|uniref:Uncharacterized protein n=1 Tax=Pleurotus eryngii TaxID=5323 RepID=A0A9P5ZJE9_PLEER|nr:hypothetical protein BDN71DRAFT_1456855 [Pleurotus eryngii]